jgi:hypothetical protein
VLGGDEDVVGHPAGVESGGLRGERRGGEAVPIERRPVVREHEPEVERGHDPRLEPVRVEGNVTTASPAAGRLRPA